MDSTALLNSTLHSSLGPLTLNSILGIGSFAVVYLATSLSKKYAVKTLFKLNLSDHQLLLQKQEAALLSSCSAHPNIVTLRDTIETEDNLFLVLDNWQGGDLFDSLVGSTESVGHSQSSALNVFAQICSAVLYCHSRGVFHRDLKPENILLQKRLMANKFSWDSALADFGLATTELKSNEFGCGSVRYMSPQCLNSLVDTDEILTQSFYDTDKNDVFSLGVILVNLLSNKNPWSEPSLSDPMFNEFYSEFTTCKNINSIKFFKKYFHFSTEIDSIVKGCLNPNPENRWSMDMLFKSIIDLIDFLDEKSINKATVVPDIILGQDAYPDSITSSKPAEEGSETVLNDSKTTVTSPTRQVSWGTCSNDMDYSAVPVFEDSPITCRNTARKDEIMVMDKESNEPLIASSLSAENEKTTFSVATLIIANENIGSHELEPVVQPTTTATITDAMIKTTALTTSSRKKNQRKKKQNKVKKVKVPLTNNRTPPLQHPAFNLSTPCASPIEGGHLQKRGVNAEELYRKLVDVFDVGLLNPVNLKGSMVLMEGLERIKVFIVFVWIGGRDGI